MQVQSKSNSTEVNREEKEEDTPLTLLYKKLIDEETNAIGLSALSVLLSFCLLIRLAVSLNSYSGFNVPPMHGDFEAQRHWMELTINLPIQQWYFYQLEYWGLDYPPLAAYHSYLLGKIGSIINPKWFELNASRGFESSDLKVFMRFTVIFSDIICFLLPCTLLIKNWFNVNNTIKKIDFLKSCSFLLFNPLFIIIDHGHFQYNCVMLGLLVLSVHYLSQDLFVLSSICFCLCIGFKQMGLYYSLSIFAYLLSKCMLPFNFTRLFKIGITVIITFGCLILPLIYEYSGDKIAILKQVLIRIFPLQRGVFEDKVASFWCSLNLVIKLKKIFEVQEMARNSAFVTLAACLPSFFNLFFKPSLSKLILTLSIHSLAFFLFSFQVHEKSILLPGLPLTLLPIVTNVFNINIWKPWFNFENYIGFCNVAMFSMFPLLKKDGLVTAYFACLFIYNFLFLKLRKVTIWFWLVSIFPLFWHILEPLVLPPARYPDIFTVLNALYSSIIFLIIFLGLNYVMYYTSYVFVKDKTE